MTAEVNIVVTERANALLVPATAVVDGHVWIVRDGRLHRQPVQSGVSGATKTEIVSGVTETDAIVVSPGAGLQEGRRVRALSGSDAAARAG